MKELDIIQMESISAGGVGNFINGACTAFATASALQLVTFTFLSSGWGIGIAAGCIVNSIGTSNGYWT